MKKLKKLNFLWHGLTSVFAVLSVGVFTGYTIANNYQTVADQLFAPLVSSQASGEEAKTYESPYENTTKYKMDFNHSEFWDWVRRMSKRNIVIVSEYNAPSDFCCIYQKQLVTTLDKNSRKNDIEKLFVLNN